MTAPRIHLADTRRGDEAVRPTLAGLVGVGVGMVLLACAPAAVTYYAAEAIVAAGLNPFEGEG